MKTRVSIVIPVFNGGEYFRLALDSALAQTYKYTEIIVVDDGSTDGGVTEGIAREAGSRITYIRKTNGGVASALNAGIEVMTGDVFCWLSHDDLFRPEKTELQVNYHRRLGSKDAVLFTDFTVMDSAGVDIGPVKLERKLLVQAPRLAVLTGSINGCTIYIPRQVLGCENPFPEEYRFVQDYRLWMRLARDYEFFHMPADTVHYRLHPNQDSHKPGAMAEGEDLWIDMMDDPSEVARAQMRGSSQRFYESICAHLTHTPYSRACAHARHRAQAIVHDTLVTIVVPVSADRFAMDATLAATLMQSHQLIEVLLVGAPELILPMRERGLDRRVRTIIVKTAPDNLAAALNAGMENSRGAYICFARPGIVVSPDWIQVRLRAMEARGLHAAYGGGPGARDITVHALIEGAWITMESVIIHRLIAAEGFKFDSAALRMGDGVVLAPLAHSHRLVSLSA
jgi:glycosyltransferase involved in cell wall biosynthesis